MPNITVYVPRLVQEVYSKDPSKKGLVVKLLMDHYGIVIKPPEIIVKTTTTKPNPNSLHSRLRNDNSGVPVDRTRH